MTAHVKHEGSPAYGGARCPVCGEPTEQPWRPFCSRRCADVDLGRWLKGSYAIPMGPAEADEDGLAVAEEGGPDGA